jgi:hypothetical protein
MKKKHIFITTIIAICSFLLGVWTTTSFGSGKVNDPRLQVFIDLYNTLKEKTTVLNTEYLDTGIKTTAVVSEYYYNLYQQYLINNL